MTKSLRELLSPRSLPGRSLLLLGPDPCLVVILVLCLPGASFGCVFASDWLAYLLLIGWPDNAKATCPGSCVALLSLSVFPGCRMSPKQDGPNQEESIVANHIHFSGFSIFV